MAKGAVFIDAEGKLKQDGHFCFERAERFVQNAINFQSVNTRSASLKDLRPTK